MVNKIDSLYKTKDLPLAAVLLTKGIHLLEVQKEGEICWFLFENKNECENISFDYSFKSVMVDARTFYQSVLRIKNIIFK